MDDYYCDEVKRIIEIWRSEKSFNIVDSSHADLIVQNQYIESEAE